MHRLRTVLLSLGTLGLLALSAPASRADSFLFTLGSPNQSAAPGSTLTFSATVTNTGGSTEYLNADSFTVDSPLFVDDTDFYTNFPLSLGAGESFTGQLFTVFLPSTTMSGLYAGSFQIIGGTDPADFTDVLASANFDVSATPEPSSLLLLSTGVLGGAVFLNRRRLPSAAHNLS